MAVGGIAHVDAEGGELVAESVRGGKVTGGAGGGASLEQLGRAVRQSRLLHGGVEQQPQRAIEIEQKRAALRIGQVEIDATSWAMANAFGVARSSATASVKGER